MFFCLLDVLHLDHKPSQTLAMLENHQAVPLWPHWLLAMAKYILSVIILFRTIVPSI